MFRSCTAIAFIMALSVQGQDSTSVMHHSKWSVGVNGSPDLAYRKLEVVEPIAFPSIIDLRDRIEVPRFAYSGRVMIGYSFNDRLGLETGVGYSLLGWQLDFSELTFGDQIDERRGFMYDPAIPQIKAWRQAFHYLDFPLKGTLILGKGRLRSISSLGISVSILMRATSTFITSDDRSVTDQDYFEQINLFPMISTGITYRLNDRHELRVEPIFRYGILRIIEPPITGYLWSGGVNFGWYVRL